MTSATKEAKRILLTYSFLTTTYYSIMFLITQGGKPLQRVTDRGPEPSEPVSMEIFWIEICLYTSNNNSHSVMFSTDILFSQLFWLHPSVFLYLLQVMIILLRRFMNKELQLFVVVTDFQLWVIRNLDTLLGKQLSSQHVPIFPVFFG